MLSACSFTSGSILAYKLELTEAELNAELEEGYADMVAGRTKPARQAFADIRKDYGLPALSHPALFLRTN